MIVFSDALVALTPITIDAKMPIIGYANLVATTNIAADLADPNYPVTNLANTQTSSLWKSTALTSPQYVTITLDGTLQSDYIGLARHNLGSGLCTVSVEGFTVASGAWVQQVSPQLLGDDSPAMFLFAADYYTGLRLKLQPASVIPQAAVVYAGKSLQLQRGVQVGHTPLKLGRNRQMTASSAMNGDFLGNIVVSQKLSSSAVIKNIDPAWFRANMQPFVTASRDPFFFAWAPRDYPAEVSYAWCSNDPQPVISQLPGYIDITLPMDGLGL